MKPLYLRAHTAARMEHRQLAGIAARKTRELVVPNLPVNFDRRYESQVPEDPAVRLSPVMENTATLRACLNDATRERYRRRTREAADGAPTFMNRTLRVAEGTNVDWSDSRFDNLPLGWRLKLYAFQPLSWMCQGLTPEDAGASELQETYDGWIDDWIASTDIGGERYLRRAWTPWAVSLRIIVWCRYLAWRQAADRDAKGADFERSFRRELYKNALFLRNHVEWDVGGNHLIENGAALVVAGLVFSERPWIDEGVSILSTVAADQFLADGYHFERSPMYHVLTLTRYLTVCGLLERNGRPVPEELQTVAQKGSEFLRFLRPPDGRIPLFNDAVYGEAIPLDACLRYAEALGVVDNPLSDRWTPPGGYSTSNETSGYRWLTAENGALLVDGGPVGPPHLPGHSHSDTLSVLLWLGDWPIFTDTGTLGYTTEPDRNYARGVRGHNTVQVGNTEPIVIGGKYLMGPRPEPTTRFENGAVSLFEGRYEAEPYACAAYTHHRAVHSGTNWWLVRDLIKGADSSPVRGRLHLHPDVEASVETSGRVRLEFGESATAFLYPMEETRVGITPSRYFPRFGVTNSRPVLELYAGATGMGPRTVGFLISQQEFGIARPKTAPSSPVLQSIQLDEETHQVPEIKLFGSVETLNQ